MFGGSRKRISIEANIPEATSITIDGRKHKNIEFPYSVKIKRGFNETFVEGEMDHYETAQMYIDKTFFSDFVNSLI